MNRIVYNRVSFSDEFTPGTITIIIEGNINEERPSDMHCRKIILSAERGSYTVDFSIYNPSYKFDIDIKSINSDSIEIVFQNKELTLKAGRNLLLSVKERQSSYDGPWFTAEDRIYAVWTKKAGDNYE